VHGWARLPWVVGNAGLLGSALIMLVAMGIAAAFCVGIGVMPKYLYALLPYPVAYEPYSASHVLAQMQLLMFSALAFSILMWTRVYPPEMRLVNLDVDWFWRAPGMAVLKAVARICQIGNFCLGTLLSQKLQAMAGLIDRHRLPDGLLIRSWPTGSMSLWVMVMLFAYLLVYYIGN